MARKICLDTDVLIDFLRGDTEATAFIEEHENNDVLATTYVNLFELYHGAYASSHTEDNLESVHRLAERLRILSFSEDSAAWAGKALAELEDEGNKVEFRDLLIGSIAADHDHYVKTNNVDHFERIPDVVVLDSN